MVGLGPWPSPGLEEGGQANQRCSMLSPGLSEGKKPCRHLWMETIVSLPLPRLWVKDEAERAPCRVPGQSSLCSGLRAESQYLEQVGVHMTQGAQGQKR